MNNEFNKPDHHKYREFLREFVKEELSIQISLAYFLQLIPNKRVINQNKIKFKIFTDLDSPKRVSMAYKEYGIHKIPFIEFDFKYPVYDDKNIRIIHIEYSHIALDKEIGNICGDWKVYCSALISHELSHLIQFYHNNWLIKFHNLNVIDLSGHGDVWQYIYRKFRITRVNPMKRYKQISLFDEFKNKTLLKK